MLLIWKLKIWVLEWTHFADETIVQVLQQQLLLSVQLSIQPSFCSAIRRTSCLQAPWQLPFLVTCCSQHPCAMTGPGQVMLQSATRHRCTTQSKTHQAGRGQAPQQPRIPALKCSPVQQLEAAVIALWPWRRNALAVDDMTLVQCSVTWKNLPPLQGIPPPPKGAAKALNQRQRSRYSNVVRNFYLETWYKFVTQHWVHNSDARAYAVTTETRECFGQLL